MCLSYHNNMGFLGFISLIFSVALGKLARYFRSTG